MKPILFKILLLFLPFAAFAEEHHPVVVLGGGPGALTSALYLARFGTTPLVVEGSLPGGRITQSHKVQNWPGEWEISGEDLMKKMRSQVEKNGVLFLKEEIVEVDFSQKPYRFVAAASGGKKHTFTADACIIAMGAKPNLLHVKGEDTYWGKGVTNCATCDGPLFKGKTIAVVGGGDAALLETDYLSQIASKVYLFVRGDSFRTVEEKRKKEILARSNVEVHYKTTIEEIFGDGEQLEGVVVKEKGEKKKISLEGVFLAIGSKPNTEIFQKKLELDPKGYIVLKEGQRTSVPGVYALGDISDPVYKQAISAAGDGAKAAIEAHHDILSRAATFLTPQKASLGFSSSSEHKIKEIQDAKEWESLLKTSSSPILAEFYASWCGPCKNLAPVLEEKAGVLSSEYQFVKINVETIPAFIQKYQVKGLPTLVLFKDGKEMERKVGPMAIVDFLEQKEKSLAVHE